MQHTIWDPYISGTQTEFGNTTAGRGWGLAIVNRIITGHNGTISLNSSENKGTTFTIRLPK